MWRAALKITIFAMMMLVECFNQSAFADTLDDFWRGKAHFEQIASINWNKPSDTLKEFSAWFSVQDGTWYAFGRSFLGHDPNCPHDHTAVVVRASRDGGRTWTNAALAVSPGASQSGDGCAILDGSSYYDSKSNVWDMIVQCIDKNNEGGWSLCHYTRKGSSPLGPFTADPSNPVVRGNSLWSRICAGDAKGCNPKRTRDEGTPDIVEKVNGFFVVTFHGFDYKADQSYRGVARTKDFRTWYVAGDGLPDRPILGPESCQTWFDGCVGVGESTSLISGGYQYLLFEAMSKSLLCTDGQEWDFGLVRAPVGKWPREGDWQNFHGNPLLKPSWPGPKSRCGLQYARWIRDKNDIFILYEDWGPEQKFVDRRLLKLVPGGSPEPLVVLKPFAQPSQAN